MNNLSSLLFFLGALGPAMLHAVATPYPSDDADVLPWWRSSSTTLEPTDGSGQDSWWRTFQIAPSPPAAARNDGVSADNVGGDGMGENQHDELLPHWFPYPGGVMGGGPVEDDTP